MGLKPFEYEATEAGAQAVIPGAEQRHIGRTGRKPRPQADAAELPLFEPREEPK